MNYNSLIPFVDFPLRFDTPVINVMFSDTVEDNRTLLYLSAFIPDVTSSIYNKNFTLKIVIYEVPQGFTFNKGSRNGSRVTLEREDFGDVWLTPRKDFSGLLSLNITAEATTPRDTKAASSQIEIKIEAVADAPALNVSVPCYHWNSSEKIPLSLFSRLNDRDGSENLTITASGLPTGFRFFEMNVTQVVNGSNNTAWNNWRGWYIAFNGILKPFSLNVTATAEEKSNGDKANKTLTVDVEFCGKFCETDGSSIGIITLVSVSKVLSLLLSITIVKFLTISHWLICSEWRIHTYGLMQSAEFCQSFSASVVGC